MNVCCDNMFRDQCELIKGKSFKIMQIHNISLMKLVIGWMIILHASYCDVLFLCRPVNELLYNLGGLMLQVHKFKAR